MGNEGQVPPSESNRLFRRHQAAGSRILTGRYKLCLARVPHKPNPSPAPTRSAFRESDVPTPAFLGKVSRALRPRRDFRSLASHATEELGRPDSYGIQSKSFDVIAYTFFLVLCMQTALLHTSVCLYKKYQCTEIAILLL